MTSSAVQPGVVPRPTLRRFLTEQFPAVSVRQYTDTAYWTDCRRCGRSEGLLVEALIGGGVVVRCLAQAEPDLCDGHHWESAPAPLNEDQWINLLGSVRVPVPGSPNASGITILSIDAMSNLPGMTPLIHGPGGATLFKRTVAFLAAKHAAGKTYVALSMAASVASGTPWLGRPVEQGRVLYLPGEGFYGLGSRLDAWQDHHGARIPADNFDVGDAVPHFSDLASVTSLGQQIEAGCYSLVVIDTFSRAMAGLDENSSRDASKAVAALDYLRDAAGDGTILVPHHLSKSGSFRGSSVLEAAADTVYLLDARDGSTARMLTRDKNKYGTLDDAVPLVLQEIGDDAVMIEGDPDAPIVDETRLRIANAIRTYLNAHGAQSKNSVRDAVQGRNTLIAEVLARLGEVGLVDVDNSGRFTLYSLPEGDRKPVTGEIEQLNAEDLDKAFGADVGWGDSGSSRAWRRLRSRVLDRDGHVCQLRLPDICTGDADEVHHIHGRDASVPLGHEDPSELQASCEPCNRHLGRPF